MGFGRFSADLEYFLRYARPAHRDAGHGGGLATLDA